jgi:hypothetical protein
MTTTTTVFPKKGVTLFLPGGVHGFTDQERGVPVPTGHATTMLAVGHVETAEQRKAAADLAKAETEKAAAQQAAAAPAEAEAEHLAG